MAIITISRELAALGDETAHELAKQLDYRFVDKHTLEARMKSYGVEGRKLERYDERKPSFFASLSQDRDDYLHYLKTAMLNEAQAGSAVFIGRGTGMVFGHIPGVLSVFLVAPLDIRCQRVKNYFHCDEKRARQIIEQSDRDRQGFHRYFFDHDWRNPAGYQMTLNTGNLAPRVCAGLIRRMLEQTLDPETEALHRRRLEDLILAQQAVHHILYERGIAIHFLEAAASGDTLVLYGAANSQALVEEAAAAAREVPGIAQVQPEIQVVQEYAVIP